MYIYIIYIHVYLFTVYIYILLQVFACISWRGISWQHDMISNNMQLLAGSLNQLLFRGPGRCAAGCR